MDLENGQVLEAIEQVKSHCRLLEEQRDYSGISLRGALYTLGYVESEADQVIQYCADRGFTYCIDPMILSTHYDPQNPNAVNSMVTEYISEQACYWGDPAQLRSRLESVYRGRV